MFRDQIIKLATSINQHSDPKVKSWFENYIKGSAPFIGVKMPVVRIELHNWYREHISGKLSLEQRLDLAFTLIQQK